MFTQEEYIWAWTVYLIGASLFLLCWWLLSAKIKWRGLRHVSRIVVAVLFLTPWYTESQSEYLSPAWLASGIEGAFEGPEAFWRAGYPLLAATLGALIISSIVYTALWFKSRRPQERQEPTLDMSS